MRILEEEIMMSEEEVIAYDFLVKKYMQILHAGFVETVINLSPPDGRFLDVGTGTGWIAIGVVKNTLGIEVTGVDLSETMLNVAEKNARGEGVQNRTRFMKGDAKGLHFEDGSFDAVFCHNMLHHLPEPDKLVSEMMRVAKKDGTIIIRDLIRHSPLVAKLHVNLLGMTYNKLMKKEYLDSILAALSETEWYDLFNKMNLKGARVTKQFVTHISMERPSERKRINYVSVPTPFYLKPFKSFYVSKL